MEDSARIVFEVVHSIWEDWSQECRWFRYEVPPRPPTQCEPTQIMQPVFEAELNLRLPPGWRARKPAGWSAGHSAFSPYDIGVRYGDLLVALLELSLGDTNVAHALHNGELKLLGDCNGTGDTTGKAFSEERRLTPHEVAAAQERLHNIPLRGLFFVGPGPVLKEPRDTVWFETKKKGFSGETKFRSALFPTAEKATLEQAFERLAESGLYCWFYSLCGEDSLECVPGRTPLCQRRTPV